jgi:hypothetical protein
MWIPTAKQEGKSDRKTRANWLEGIHRAIAGAEMMSRYKNTTKRKLMKKGITKIM